VTDIPQLGYFGVRVSRFGVGFMSFGDTSRGFSEWSLGDEEAQHDIEGDQPIVEAVQKVAEARGIPMAHAALPGVLKHPVVTAPIVGPTKPHHLPDAVSILDVHLT